MPHFMLDTDISAFIPAGTFGKPANETSGYAARRTIDFRSNAR
jgi:hypothetical protein